MSIVPGSNLLKRALRTIANQQVEWYRASFRTLNAVGQDVPVYASPITVKCSFQPVPWKLYQLLGLDLQKEYYRLYVPSNVIDIARNVSADMIGFQNNMYLCESATEWFGMDGWVEMLLVYVSLPPAFLLNPIFGFGTDGGVAPDSTYFNFDNAPFWPDGAGP